MPRDPEVPIGPSGTLAPPPKVPPSLEGEVRALSGQGWTNAKIAAWLRSTHGVEVTPRALCKRFAHDRKSRAVAAKAAVAAHVAASVTSDLDTLDLRIERLRVKIERLEADDSLDSWEHYMRGLEALRRLLDCKLRHSGTGEPASGSRATSLEDFLAAALEDE